MALFASSLITAASGSVGGLTFLRSGAGMALRGRAIPVHHNTPLQAIVKARFAYLNHYWTDLLQPTDRSRWDAYADQVPRPRTFGSPRSLGGHAMWIRNNYPRLEAGFEPTRFAPIHGSLGSFTPVLKPRVNVLPQTFVFNFDNTDAWANEHNAALLLYVARPRNQSVRRFRFFYRFAGQVDGNSFLPPRSPATIPLPFVYYRNQRAFFRVAATFPNGRYSESQTGNVVAI